MAFRLQIKQTLNGLGNTVVDAFARDFIRNFTHFRLRIFYGHPFSRQLQQLGIVVVVAKGKDFRRAEASQVIGEQLQGGGFGNAFVGDFQVGRAGTVQVKVLVVELFEVGQNAVDVFGFNSAGPGVFIGLKVR